MSAKIVAIVQARMDSTRFPKKVMQKICGIPLIELLLLRLSKSMTYKAAIAGLNLGGGKAVIIGDPKIDKSEELFRSFGRFIDGLGGRYITAEDVGTSIKDMDFVRMETKHVTGISKS